MKDVIIGLAIICWACIAIVSVAVLLSDLIGHFTDKDAEWNALMEAVNGKREQ